MQKLKEGVSIGTQCMSPYQKSSLLDLSWISQNSMKQMFSKLSLTATPTAPVYTWIFQGMPKSLIRTDVFFMRATFCIARSLLSCGVRPSVTRRHCV